MSRKQFSASACRDRLYHPSHPATCAHVLSCTINAKWENVTQFHPSHPAVRAYVLSCTINVKWENVSFIIFIIGIKTDSANLRIKVKFV